VEEEQPTFFVSNTGVGIRARGVSAQGLLSAAMVKETTRRVDGEDGPSGYNRGSR
jgi:hypothetical protein